MPTDLVDSFIAAKRVEGCSPRTIKYYRVTCAALINYVRKPADEITTNDVRLYLDELSKTNSKITIDNNRRVFSSFFTWLENEELIVRSPMRKIKKTKVEKTVKKAITDEEFELLRNTVTNARNLAILDFLVSTGIRVSELVGLNRDDINFNDRSCIVFGKGEKEREVYFDARAKVSLQNYLSLRSDDNIPLFVSLLRPYQRLQISGVEIMLRNLGKKTNLEKIHPHKFRRTMATNAIDKGMPIELVQQILGHATLDMTTSYAMVKQANVKAAHRKYLG